MGANTKSDSQTKPRRTQKWLRRLAAPVVIIAVAVPALYWSGILRGNSDASGYLTALVKRAPIDLSVSPTGTVNAVSNVAVGSQVSGTVSWLGADFNSKVKKGQVIARLDPAIFQKQLNSQLANLRGAEAAVKSAETDIGNQKFNVMAAVSNNEVLRVQLKDAQDLFNRDREIGAVISPRDLEAAKAQASLAAARYQQAAAQIAQAQAALGSSEAKAGQAKAVVSQARAQVEQAKINLDHSVITSPIDGTIVSRNVDVGQTIAASLQAPTLFTIANDMREMQVLASVDEADIGQLHEGVAASITVDAYPALVFKGQVLQIRLNSQALQNVVTYTAVIDVPNPDRKLLPGMTVNVTMAITHLDNTLTVPNSALRFNPVLKGQEAVDMKAKTDALRRQHRAAASSDTAKPGAASSPGQIIWVLLDKSKLDPRLVTAGITDGKVTAVVGGNLSEGEVVVIGK